MKEQTGNLWETVADAYIITTNGTLKKDGTLVMGKGCAREARDMFPGIDKLLGNEVAVRGNVPLVFRAKVDGGMYTHLITLPTKRNWFEDSDLELIKEGLPKLMNIANKMDFEIIAMPRPGCGNGNKDWETEVKPLLEPILDERFVVVSAAL